jgi:hypothetical protein
MQKGNSCYAASIWHSEPIESARFNAQKQKGNSCYAASIWHSEPIESARFNAQKQRGSSSDRKVRFMIWQEKK